jgi:hypothetical protein
MDGYQNGSQRKQIREDVDWIIMPQGRDSCKDATRTLVSIALVGLTQLRIYRPLKKDPLVWRWSTNEHLELGMSI